MRNDWLNNPPKITLRDKKAGGFFMKGSWNDCERGECQKPLYARLKERLQKESARVGERKTRGEAIEACERLVWRCGRYGAFSPLPHFSARNRSMSSGSPVPFLQPQTARSITKIADWIADDQDNSRRRSVLLEKVQRLRPEAVINRAKIGGERWY